MPTSKSRDDDVASDTPAAFELAHTLCEAFDTYMERTSCDLQHARDGMSLFVAAILVQLRRVGNQCGMPIEAERYIWQFIADSLAQMQALESKYKDQWC
jgi:hypothetical protein